MPAAPMVARTLDTRGSLSRASQSLFDQATPAPAPAAPKAGGRGAGRGATGLGKNANTAATAGQSPAEKRNERFKARRTLGPITTLKRVSKCGRVSMIEGGEVQLRMSESDGCRTAGLGGLVTCGSLWACPVCSAKITVRRAMELEKVVAWNADRQGTIALATFTMRHHSGHRLKTLWKGLSTAWRHLTGSRAWKTSRADLGLDGYVRATEATYGENGWHLHIHALMLFDGPVSPERIELLADELYELWSDGLAKSGLTAEREHGVDVRLGKGALDGLGKYLSKITWEVTGARFKKGRRTGRSPFQLLNDGLATGNADDLELWFEWEQASHRQRQLVWSRGLKARAGLEEITDEEIAEENEGGQLVAVLPARTWRQVWVEAEKLLHATETGGAEWAYRWLDLRGLIYEVDHLQQTGPAAA